MKKIKVLITATLVASLLGITSFAAVTTTSKGVQKLDSADIVDVLNNNADVLEDHIDNVAGTDILGHVKIGSGLQATEDGTASVKIGSGLQSGEDGSINAKIANDLTTDDSNSSLSAAMGVELNKNIGDTKSELSSQIQDVESKMPTRPLEQKGFVNDCITETTEAGYYQYYANTTNSPSNAEGIVVSMPWFEMSDGSTWNQKYSFRLAIDANGNMYTSVYKSGQDWGSWKQN